MPVAGPRFIIVIGCVVSDGGEIVGVRPDIRAISALDREMCQRVALVDGTSVVHKMRAGNINKEMGQIKLKVRKYINTNGKKTREQIRL